MRFSISTIVPAAALLSSASARIVGISAPATIAPNQPFTVQLLTENYIQSVYDVAVAWGIAQAPGFPESLGVPIGSFSIGPLQSNIETPITYYVPLGSEAEGNYVLGASVMSLYGAVAEPTLVNFNVTVTVGAATSTETVTSTN